MAGLPPFKGQFGGDLAGFFPCLGHFWRQFCCFGGGGANLLPNFGKLGPRSAQNFVVDPKKQQNYNNIAFGPKAL